MKVALIAAFTRSMWLGAIGGGAYLIWMWRRWMVLAIPVGIALVLLINPFAVRERALSVFQPHGDTDSNEHRVVTRKIGWEMIKAHPWLGLGPEEVGKQYRNYIPSSVKLPLPTGYYGHLHNIYIHYAAERGVPAMLALMWMLGQALVRFHPRLASDCPGGWRQPIAKRLGAAWRDRRDDRRSVKRLVRAESWRQRSARHGARRDRLRLCRVERFIDPGFSGRACC